MKVSTIFLKKSSALLSIYFLAVGFLYASAATFLNNPGILYYAILIFLISILFKIRIREDSLVLACMLILFPLSSYFLLGDNKGVELMLFWKVFIGLSWLFFVFLIELFHHILFLLSLSYLFPLNQRLKWIFLKN